MKHSYSRHGSSHLGERGKRIKPLQKQKNYLKQAVLKDSRFSDNEVMSICISIEDCKNTLQLAEIVKKFLS